MEGVIEIVPQDLKRKTKFKLPTYEKKTSILYMQNKYPIYPTMIFFPYIGPAPVLQDDTIWWS